MGKALVINGLVVSNPLCVVNFSEKTPQKILASYYSKNKTISISEKKALEDFVGKMIDLGIMQKVKVFMPILGTEINNMILDVVNPENLLANAKNYTVDGRSLVFANVNYDANRYALHSDVNTECDIFYSCRIQKGNSYAFNMITDDNNSLILNPTYGGFKVPKILFYNKELTMSGTVNDVKRFFHISVQKNVFKASMNGNLIDSKSIDNTSSKFQNIVSFSTVLKGNNTNSYVDLFIVTDKLTDEEVTIMSDYIDKFLNGVNKKI